MEKMYSDLASWWHLLSPPAEYAEEFETFRQILIDSQLPPHPTLLELGSGGGNNALYLKTLFAHCTLTDLSANMLDLSRTLNPECEHLQSDMRSLRLNRTYDVVFVHDAIEYMTTLDDLRLALLTASLHCKPGGLALFVPDQVKETFVPSTETGGTDDATRGMRFLEWTYDPDESDTTYTVEYAYLLRENGKPVAVEHETHLNGLFPRAEWLRLLRALNFDPHIVSDPFGREIFVARKTAALA